MIVPILNRYDLLEEMLGSINYPIDNILIIDNGGQFKTDKDVKVLNMPANLGLSASWNLGIKMTPFASGWILLNSDAFFERGELQKFYRECHTDEIHLAGQPGWCCAWIGSQVVKDVGLFCEAFHPAYFEDNDYERRALRMGKQITKSQAIVYHDNSSTLQSDPTFIAKNQATFELNLELFKLRNVRLDAGEWDLQRRIDLSWD